MTQFLPVLERCPLFAGIPPAELRHWLDALPPRLRTLGRNEFLFHMGEQVRQIGLVLSGSLHILYEDAFGGRTILAAAGPGDMVAEAYACAEIPLEVSVSAGEESTILLLDSGFLLSGASPISRQIRDNLIRVLAGKNLILNEKIRHLTRRTTREKLLSYLSAQRQRSGNDTFRLPFDRQQLADYLSVDRSAMCTELGKLRREGLLQCRGRNVTLYAPWEESGEPPLQTGENTLK